MNPEALARIGRILKASCPKGAGFAAIIDGGFVASGERPEVQRMLSEWLRKRPLVTLAAAPSAALHGQKPDESPEDFADRKRLELQCAAMAETVAGAWVSAVASLRSN